jgi:hypothetical protein
MSAAQAATGALTANVNLATHSYRLRNDGFFSARMTFLQTDFVDKHFNVLLLFQALAHTPPENAL